MAKKTLNPLVDTPTTLRDLTQEFMYNYIKAKGSKEDIKWFKETVEKYTGEVENKFTHEKQEGVADLPALRKDFANRFFSHLNTKKEKKKAKSFIDLVKELE